MTVWERAVYAEPMARLGAEDNSVHDAATVTGLLDQLTPTSAPGPLEPSSRPVALDTADRFPPVPAPAPPTWVERMLVLQPGPSPGVIAVSNRSPATTRYIWPGFE